VPWPPAVAHLVHTPVHTKCRLYTPGISEPETSPAERVRKRMNELRVGHLSEFPIGPVADNLRDAIGARDLGNGDVEILDRTGKSWTGNADAALKAISDLQPTDVGDPTAVWERLSRAS
jgi:hypothetical protein